MACGHLQLKHFGLVVALIFWIGLASSFTLPHRDAVETPHFVFAWHTGHTGSQSLASPTAYDGLDHVFFSHPRVPKPGSPSLHAHDCQPPPWNRQIARRDVARWYVEIRHLLLMHNKTVYADMSHVLRTGWGPALAEVLGERMTVFRLRRSRYLIAESLSLRSHLPCSSKRQSGRLDPCLDSNRVSLELKNKQRFLKLSRFQRALWWVDEAEAEWYHFLRRYGKQINVAGDVNFALFNDAMFMVLPAMLGVGVPHPIQKNRHVHRSTRNHECVITPSQQQADHEYKEVMNFTRTEQRWIAGAQF